MSVCMHACMHACIYVFLYACIYVCMHLSTYPYIYIYELQPILWIAGKIRDAHRVLYKACIMGPTTVLV